MRESMIAATYDTVGAAHEVLRLEELPKPVPGRGEVLVRLRTSGVNPSDWKARGGRRLGDAYPKTVPHSDGAGIIEEVGTGVSAARLGERVWIWNGQWRRPFGTAAQFIALPSIQAVPLPDVTDFDAGACLGIPARTAWRAVFYDRPPNGELIFIPGGAGAVANYAIQLAKMAGAEVITSVSSDDKARAAQRAGADLIINYKKENVTERIVEYSEGRGVDRLLDLNLARNVHSYVKVVKPEGTVVIYGSEDWSAPIPLSDFLIHGLRLGIFVVYNLPDALRRRATEDINGHLRAGRLKHLIARRFPLAAIADAHELQETGGYVGNIILEIPE